MLRLLDKTAETTYMTYIGKSKLEKMPQSGSEEDNKKTPIGQGLILI